MSGRRATGASLLAGADADDVWPVEHRLTNADRADVMRIALKIAGVGLQVPSKYDTSFETELLAALLPERLRPTELDRRTGLLKCQHTILGKLVTRDEIKYVINKTHADGKVTSNTWHIHVADGNLVGKAYAESLVALQTEIREHYKPHRLRVLQLARSVHPRTPLVSPVTAVAALPAAASPAAAAEGGAPSASPTASSSPAAAAEVSPAVQAVQFLSPAVPAVAASAAVMTSAAAEETPAAVPAKRNKPAASSAKKQRSPPTRVSPVAQTPAREEETVVGTKRKSAAGSSPLGDVDITPPAARAAAPAPAAAAALPAFAAQALKPALPPAAPAASSEGDRPWLIISNERIDYRQIQAKQSSKHVAFEVALFKLLERSDATSLDAVYSELHQAGMNPVHSAEVAAFLAKREAEGHIMTDYPEIYRI